MTLTDEEMCKLIAMSSCENALMATFGPGYCTLLPSCAWAIEAVKKMRTDSTNETN